MTDAGAGVVFGMVGVVLGINQQLCAVPGDCLLTTERIVISWIW